MQKKIWLIVSGVIIVVVLLPVGIDWLIIGNSFPSNVSNSDWLGFLGGYIGSILGCSISLVGLFLTIKFTKQQLQMNKNQFEEQKRMNYIPILDCAIIGGYEGRNNDAVSLDVEYTHSSQELIPCTLKLDISNVGPGAALELKYGIEFGGEIQDGWFWLDRDRLVQSQGKLTQNCTLYIPKNKEFKPTLLVYYEDVLGNRYVKRVFMHAFYTEESDEFEVFILKQDRGNIVHECQKEKYYVITHLKDT